MTQEFKWNRVNGEVIHSFLYDGGQTVTISNPLWMRIDTDTNDYWYITGDDQCVVVACGWLSHQVTPVTPRSKEEIIRDPRRGGSH